jgi:hypothetical protein
MQEIYRINTNSATVAFNAKLNLFFSITISMTENRNIQKIDKDKNKYSYFKFK